MHIEIDTNDRELLLELVGKPPFREPGEKIQGPDGVALIYDGMNERRGLDFPTPVRFVVEHLDELATGLFASWLYDKLKDRAQKLRANGEEIRLTPEAVRRIFEKEEKQ